MHIQSSFLIILFGVTFLALYLDQIVNRQKYVADAPGDKTISPGEKIQRGLSVILASALAVSLVFFLFFRDSMFEQGLDTSNDAVQAQVSGDPGHFVTVANATKNKTIRPFYYKQDGIEKVFLPEVLKPGSEHRYSCGGLAGTAFWVEVTSKNGTKELLRRNFDYREGNMFKWTVSDDETPNKKKGRKA